ncbi:MAG: hypothetical protein RL264_840 [Bacteroidota bacterium]|jgi:hypothetical protein
MKMKKMLLSAILMWTSSVAFSQHTKQPIDWSNVREGEHVEYCHTHKKMAALKENPEIKKAMIKDEEEFQQILKKGGTNKGVVYTIPVVFHVLHNGGIENISDAQIMDALAILNRDYRLLNADAQNVQTAFQGMPTDVEVEFRIATKAPNGACFKGITRTLSTATNTGSDGSVQVNAIKAGNDVFQGNWPGNKYLNVFICAEIGGAAGYTTNPSSWSATSMNNGIWMLHNYVGSFGTSSVTASRALTHEVGHWLNLSHTWGPNNNPGNASSCSSDDGVDDTPNCIGVTSCALNANTCSTDNAYWGFDQKDNVENYMDYSYCSKMFTAGQVERMRTALQQTSTGRFNIWQTANLNSVGATGNPFLCSADFTSPRNTVCLGDQVELNDASYNLVTGWTWEITPSTGWTFASGSSATSQNPVIVFSQSGLYSVKLTATDGTTTNSKTKSNFIRVLPASATVPFWEGFEGYTTLNDLPNWEVYNPNANNGFDIESTTAYGGSKCAKLVNFGQPASCVDELISSTIDLSTVPSSSAVTLSFRYANRKRATANYEYLKVFISGDCGQNWVPRKTIGGTQLSNQTATTSWKPTQTSDWTTVHMVNVTSNYFLENFKMKFRFESDGGNNLYLDDINLYEGAPSDNVVVGLNEIENWEGVQLFPNPTDAEVNVRFTMTAAESVNVTISDITGKVAHRSSVKANEGANHLIFDTSNLAAGVYMMQLTTNGKNKTLQFVVK